MLFASVHIQLCDYKNNQNILTVQSFFVIRNMNNIYSVMIVMGCLIKSHFYVSKSKKCLGYTFTWDDCHHKEQNLFNVKKKSVKQSYNGVSGYCICEHVFFIFCHVLVYILYID